MKNNRGFTLIEIIVSIALLGIISVGMLSGLTTQFRFLTDTKVFTEDLSTAQQGMEDKISDVKKTLENNGTPSGGEDYTLFSGTYARTVVGYPRYQEISVDSGLTRLLSSVVGTETLEYPVAAVTDVDLTFQPNDSPTFNSTSYIYYDNLYAKSAITLDDPDGVNLTNIYRWYVSRAGFNIPMIAATPEETEVGTKYPRFPEDYDIIPNKSNDTLYTVASDYRGRHILCTVTPAANSGKMGATTVSNPLFISGLPVKNNLMLHLDASMIDRESSSQVSTSGDDYYVRQWRDISGKGNSASQSSDDKRPQLVETFIGYIEDDGTWYDSYVKYAAFDGVNDLVSASVAASVDDTGTSSTVFVVARPTGATDFTIYKNTVPGEFVSFASGWGSTTLTIGNNSTAVDVAEVIVYNAVLSDDGEGSDCDRVMKYLENKYLPTTPEVFIRWLTNPTVTVMKSDSDYTPPSTVSAYTSLDRYQDVGVTWNPETINISTTGTKYSTGTAVDDSEEHCTLTVNVVEPASLAGIGDITISDNGTHAKLTAGDLTPSGATATYQWQSGSSSTGPWSSVPDVTSAVYNDATWGLWYQVIATGSGNYVGSVTSDPVELTVTAITAIATPYVTGGGTYAELTAGDLTPSAATATYQWQISYNNGYSWSDVGGATDEVYSYASWGSLYRVVATGSGGYTGIQESGSVRPEQVPLTGIGAIALYWSGDTPTLTAGAVAPSGATVTYQWQQNVYVSGWGWGGGYWTWQDISGATYSSYTATYGTEYRVVATGTGMYTGTATSASLTAEKSPLSNIDDIILTWDGDNPVLTAGALSPSGASATYQWYVWYGYWQQISGATSNIYTGASTGYYYRVTATGANGYTGSVNSNYIYVDRTAITNLGAISVSWNDNGTPVLTAGAVSPSGATVNYQWQIKSGSWQDISGATSNIYTGVAEQTYRVTVTGYGAYSGTITSDSVKPTQTSITAVGDITVTSWSTGGAPTMAAGAVSPSGATANYQWQVKDSGWQDISSATSATYTGVAGQTYRVTATGYGAYTGSKSSAAFTPNRIAVTGASIAVSGSGNTLTLTASVTPSSATVYYQWLDSNGNAISGATSATCAGTAGQTYSVRVTGYGEYTGAITSDPVTALTPVTSIGNIYVSSWSTSGVPTMTAGTVSPGGATVHYQWLSGNSQEISGATSNTYTGTAGQTYYVRVTGYGAYSGTATSAAFTPTRIQVAGIGSISARWNGGNSYTLTAGTVYPVGATVNYQWQIYTYVSTGRHSGYWTWQDISGATSNIYSNASGSDYYRVVVTGYGEYYDSATSGSW